MIRPLVFILTRGSLAAVLVAVGKAVQVAQPSVDPQSLIAPVLSGWIHAPLAIPVATAVPGSPISTLVAEEQINVQEKEHFRHFAMRVETEAGLDAAGQITVSFDPNYEKLHWNFIRIWRANAKREVLSADVLQVLQQEDDAERFVYHGRLSTLVILHDLRVGDVVEYAYSRSGQNPVFEGRFSQMLAGAFTVPVTKLLYRIRAPADRPLHISTHGAFVPDHRVASAEGGVEYTWTAIDLPAVRLLNDAPAWEPQIPFVQVSEYKTWSEVADWGRRLFEIPSAIGPELRSKFDQLTADLPTVEQKANALVRFVQDDIRYLAISLGESSHRPSPPDEVLRRGFGDCKDKALLLATFLRQLGLDANVALVSTDWGRQLDRWLPTPAAFDHAIVWVERPMQPVVFAPFSTGGYNGGSLLLSTSLQESARLSSLIPTEEEFSTKPASGRQPVRDAFTTPPADLDVGVGGLTMRTLWLDATATLQGGKFTNRTHANFGHALVLAKATNHLTTVEPATDPSNAISVQENITATDFSAPAKLEVITTYRGGIADYYRYSRRFSDPTVVAKQLSGFLSRYYQNVRSLDSTEWNDDRERNIVTARSHFELPEFWQLQDNGRFRVAEVTPWALSERLPRPETTERSFAFGTAYPYSVTDEIAVTLPKEWPSHSDRRRIDDDGFRFSFDSLTRGDRMVLTYRWETRTDSVPASRLADWSKKMSQVRDALGYRITQNVRLAAEMKRKGLVWSLLATTIGGLILGGGIGGWLYVRQPRAQAEPPLLSQPNLTGIAGWLILPALMIVGRPLMLAQGVWAIAKGIGNRPEWVARTDVESVSYLSGFSLLNLAQGFAIAALLAWSIVLIPQFFKKKASLPFSFKTWVLVTGIWSVANVIWMGQVLPTNRFGVVREVAEIVGVVVGTTIWIVYFSRSRRVKLTFLA